MRIVMLLCAILLPCLPTFAAGRPRTWAHPMALSGLGNLNQVTGQIYRCAQPQEEGMRQLEKLGVRTVINLRDEHDDGEKAAGTHLRLVHFDMRSWDVDEKQIANVLALLRQKERGPFVIHCHHGSDRTGLVCAVYRMVEQGWKREDAIREMREGGYGFNETWVNIVHYLQRMDIEAMRHRVDKLAAK